MFKFNIGEEVLLTVGPLGLSSVPVTIVNVGSQNVPEGSRAFYRVRFADGKMFGYSVSDKCLERG